MQRALAVALIATSAVASAADWKFSPRQTLAASRAGVFHHLDSSGRQHVALSGNTVAVVWEDNRDSTPQVYVAFKNLEGTTLGVAKRLSTGRSAAEPVIAGLGSDRFLVAWEQDGQLRLRVVGTQGLGATARVDEPQAGQASLAARGRVVLAYARPAGRYSQIVTRDVQVDASGRISVAAATAVDPEPPKGDQLAPVVAVTRQGGATVVWEDRRRGHTVLFVSQAPAGKTYGAPTLLNEQVQKSDVYGRGSGVTRAAVTTYGGDRLAAAWMDKRGFRTGYDIYAAVSGENGQAFGKNEQVQDEFGNEIAQWHAAIAGNAKGMLVAAFDDNRDDNYDIQLAVRGADGTWGANFSPPPAAGAGDQTHPAMALDDGGALHLVWLERDTDGAPTRLLYSIGRAAGP